MRRLAFRLLSVVLGVVIPQLSAAFVIDGKEVLVVSSYHPSYGWSQLVNAGIFAALTGQTYSGYIAPHMKERQSQFADSVLWMHSKHLRTDAEKRTAAQPIIATIDKRRPAIVIVADDNAVAQIIPQFVNADIQFVFCGVNGDPHRYGIASTWYRKVRNVTGILERYPFIDLFRFIRDVVPDRSDLHVFYDGSETGQLTLEDFTRTINDANTRQLLASLRLRIAKQLISNDWEEWKKEILSLQGSPQAILLFQNFFSLRDKQSQPVDYRAVIAWIRKQSRLPEFGHSAFHVASGLMATVGTDGIAHGYQAGMLARKLVDGTPIRTLATEIEGYRSISVNKARMRELGFALPFHLLSSAFVYEDGRL